VYLQFLATCLKVDKRE